jgi:LPS-assembly lipoprotein
MTVRRMVALICVALVIPALAGCGFQPLYADGSKGALATAMGKVNVSPIPERLGQLVHDGLVQELNANGAGTYRLDVKIAQSIDPIGIRSDDTATRGRVTLTANYELIDIATGKVVLRDLARSDVGVDKVRSEYATVVAEQSASERNAKQVVRQISLRLALYFRQPS